VIFKNKILILKGLQGGAFPPSGREIAGFFLKRVGGGAKGS